MFYQLSSKYLKFELREANIFKNFNLIPACDKRPKIYDEISKSIKKIRSIDSCFHFNIKKYNSKYAYCKLLDKYVIKPKIESWDECDDWSSVYYFGHSQPNILNVHERSDVHYHSLSFIIVHFHSFSFTSFISIHFHSFSFMILKREKT